MAQTPIEGKFVDIFVSTNLTTPSWKKFQCSTDLTLEGSKDTTTVSTKCGSQKSTGAASWTITGSGIHNSTPDANCISGNELITMFQASTALLVKTAHVSNETLYLRKGTGALTAYSESAGVEDNTSFDYTIEISGDLSLV